MRRGTEQWQQMREGQSGARPPHSPSHFHSLVPYFAARDPRHRHMERGSEARAVEAKRAVASERRSEDRKTENRREGEAGRSPASPSASFSFPGSAPAHGRLIAAAHEGSFGMRGRGRRECSPLKRAGPEQGRKFRGRKFQDWKSERGERRARLSFFFTMHRKLSSADLHS